MEGLRDQWITTESEFMTLSTAWNKLVEEGNYSVFYRHEWFIAAWLWQANTPSLCIYCVFKSAELIGILPLICTTQCYKKIPFKQLQFLTVPDTQFCDVIVKAGEEHAVLSRFFQALKNTPLLWDKMRLDYLTQNSPFYQHREDILNKNSFLVSCHHSNQHQYIQCLGTFENYQKNRSKKFLRSNRNTNNRWANQKDWAIHHYTHVSEEELDTLLSHWKNLINHSWKKTTTTTLMHASPYAFLKKLSQTSLRTGWFSLYVLSLKNIWVACEYQLHDQNKIFALRADYHEDYGYLSPGYFLQQGILQHCFESPSCNTYYMGPGLNPYKQLWATHQLSVVQCTAYQTNWRGKILALLDKQHQIRQEWSFTT